MLYLQHEDVISCEMIDWLNTMFDLRDSFEDTWIVRSMSSGHYVAAQHNVTHVTDRWTRTQHMHLLFCDTIINNNCL